LKLNGKKLESNTLLRSGFKRLEK